MIREIDQNGRTYFFVADDLGMPITDGYPSQAQAEKVAGLIESSDGMAIVPEGVPIDVE